MARIDDAALLLVDVQRDFCPGGSLAVPNGHEVVPALNAAIERFVAADRPIIASRDWHPAETTHFVAGGGVWPPHCVAGQAGAEFHKELGLPEHATVISKGTGATEDAYSAFQGRDEQGRDLATLLRERNVRRLVVGGLATDYCVRASVLDARRLGFEVIVLRDAIRGVEVNAGDSERAIAEMAAAGAEIASIE